MCTLIAQRSRCNDYAVLVIHVSSLAGKRGCVHWIVAYENLLVVSRYDSSYDIEVPRPNLFNMLHHCGFLVPFGIRRYPLFTFNIPALSLNP